MENVPGLSSRDKIKIIIITAIALFVSAVGISYAYFAIQITGNDTASSMRLTSANMQLIYNDVQIVSGDDIEPGWTETKTLTVQNVGNVTSYYTIIWRDLLNEITNNELLISATCVSTSGSCPNIVEKVIPTTTPEGHNINVKKNISIPVGVTHTYTVTIEFIETGSNQNYNQDKIFNGTLNIAEGKEPLQIVRSGTDSTTGLPVVKIGNEEFYDITNAIDYSALISTNGNIYNYASDKSILLAKYNLYVGRTCTSSNTSSCTPISTSASEYGLQSADAKGYVNSSTPRVAVVPFSGSSNSYGYWYDSANSTIYSKYGTSYNASNIYDTDYITAPNYSVAFSSNVGNANYSIAYYVEEYVDRLGIEGEGRLLTYTEVNAMTTAQRTNGARFCLGSGGSINRVWSVDTSGGLYYDLFYNTVYYGVRPVIVINTSDIKTVPVRDGTDSDTGLPKVTIGSETFLDLTNAINYSTLISTNGNIYNYANDKSILLAKYNLYVGQNCTADGNSCTPIDTSASGYGLQSADAKGYVDSLPRVGVVPFSGSSNGYGYWDPSNSGINSTYGTYTNYANNIYDADRVTAPNYSVAFNNNAGNANYSIAYYVEEYVNRLGIRASGRLLTYTEANAMTQVQRTNGAQYWLGSARRNNHVWSVVTFGDLIGSHFYITSDYGVRPVIIVSTSDIGA